MVRVEACFPYRDKHHNPINLESLSRILGEIGEHCGGFRLTCSFGFWKAEDGEKYPEYGLLLVSDTSFEKAKWFEQKKAEWENELNQEKFYLSVNLVEWV